MNIINIHKINKYNENRATFLIQKGSQRSFCLWCVCVVYCKLMVLFITIAIECAKLNLGQWLYIDVPGHQNMWSEMWREAVSSPALSKGSFWHLIDCLVN